jgi:plasmid stabilization system protein ParE
VPGSDAPRRAVFHPEAAAEFDEAMAYYEHEAPAVVDAFESEVMRTVVFVEQFPEAAPIDRGNVRCKLITRFKYELYYAVEPDRLRVLALCHEKRRPGYWVERLAR